MQSLVYLLKQPRANLTGSDIFDIPFSCSFLQAFTEMHLLNTNSKLDMITRVPPVPTHNSLQNQSLISYCIFLNSNKNDLVLFQLALHHDTEGYSGFASLG